MYETASRCLLIAISNWFGTTKSIVLAPKGAPRPDRNTANFSLHQFIFPRHRLNGIRRVRAPAAPVSSKSVLRDKASITRMAS